MIEPAPPSGLESGEKHHRIEEAPPSGLGVGEKLT